MDAITSASEAEEARGLPRPASTGFSSIELFLSSPKTYLFTEVDPNAATVPLAAYCFMTGYTISFSTVFIWCGFPTGNSLRGPGHPDPFQFADQEALVSIFAFAVGASLGRIGDRMGARTRLRSLGDSCRHVTPTEATQPA
ncbi:hypothetical protein EWM64_g5309 [Hericium alpestre]|uniref:Uncharacterized protein n=1 Tax=Hericium alpestre TaxID=135208 RepID=A0A4Y9ZUY4_9AGAM|nr:hypothetical protein EWM64_g5309 [Hericium alpestre]